MGVGGMVNRWGAGADKKWRKQLRENLQKDEDILMWHQ